ncbi:MAG: PEP/pyruvate-binding domain-containing protein, partial [Myxococcota bacterium]
MPRLLRRVETLVPRRAAGYGGKARNLAALARAGFPVPAAYAMSGGVCEDFLRTVLSPDEMPSALLKARVTDAARLETIASKVRDAPLTAELRRSLADAFATLQREGATAVAVRSSSTREDQEESSAAGLHETVLNVTSEAELFGAVKHCWASLFAPRVMLYLDRVGGAPDATVGIVVQAMVPSDAAGVLFTVNPLTGDAGEVVINAAYGLGSAVVDGRVSPDTLRVDKATRGPRDRVIGEKARRTVLSQSSGILEEDVPEDLRGVLSIDEELVDRLTNLALQIEAHFETPRDVEWAVAEGEIYVLQARPVTAALLPGTKRWQRKKAHRGARASIVWSNVNVGEALPGVATPLTWSVLSSFSELGFRRAFGSLGCTVPKDAELVGSFRGRIYLNMSEFMSIMTQVPGLRPKTLLALGGGGEVDRLESDIERRSPAAFLARLPWTASRFARENLGLTERLQELEATFAADRNRLTSVNPQILA